MSAHLFGSDTVTFLRVRPVASLSTSGAQVRLGEGTTVVEIPNPTPADLKASQEGQILVCQTTAENNETECEGTADFSSKLIAGWVLTPTQTQTAIKQNIDGARLTVRYVLNQPEQVLDALARSQAAFLRTGRSRVAEGARLCGLAAIAAVVSVFVDDVDEAERAVSDGASDLLLRDWDLERIGRLRQRMENRGRRLVERTVFQPGMEIDRVREQLSADLFTVWLQGVDADGCARPRYEWAPGKDTEPPVPTQRLSAQWADRMWVDAPGTDGIAGAGQLTPILERSLSGSPPNLAETVELFRAKGTQVEAIAWVADQLRSERVGEEVSYVINRNINYTNMCYFRCGFCAFSKGPKSLNLRGDPYLMSITEIVENSQEAWERGATEVTLQGGIHPDFSGDFYVQVVEGIKSVLPEMHIHGFTPLEVWQGAETLGVSVADFLGRLQEAGLGSLPGTAAEILDDKVRRFLCPDKITSSEWAYVMRTAHELGLSATTTIMFGHIDHPRAWANHLEVIKSVQRETGGFTEMVPLPFVHMGSPIFLRGRSRPGPTWDEVVLVHAVSRLALDGLIPNIQASWVKLGLEGGARLLSAGCNDLGGTLMGEIITRSAGASHGQEVSPEDFIGVIADIDRIPVQRNTLYQPISPRVQLSIG